MQRRISFTLGFLLTFPIAMEAWAQEPVILMPKQSKLNVVCGGRKIEPRKYEGDRLELVCDLSSGSSDHLSRRFIRTENTVWLNADSSLNFECASSNFEVTLQFAHKATLACKGKPENQAPSVEILKPASHGEYVTDEAQIVLQGLVEDSDGQISQLIWFDRKDRGGDIIINGQWTSEPIALFEGNNFITVKATDNDGLTDKDEIRIQYLEDNQPPPPPPVTGRNFLNQLFLDGSWHIPASELTPDNSRRFLVQRLINNASPGSPGNFNINYDEYTYPVYVADASTPRLVVKSRNPGWSNIDGQTIPFDEDWIPSGGFWDGSSGNDNQSIIVDPLTDRYFDLWQISRPENGTLRVSNGSVIRNASQSDGINAPSRGCGIAYFAMLVHPEEVAAGKIDHALSMAINNSGNTFVAPAVKTDGSDSDGIPMGTRFALTMSDSALESWVSSKPANLQPLARALGYALRDYGWIINDSAGWGVFQIEDVLSARERWESLGVDYDNPDQLRDLLDGLDWENAIVLEPR